MKTSSAAVLATLVLLSACAKKHNDAVTQPVVATPPSVTGEYSTLCLHDIKQQIDLNYQDNGQLTQTIENFDDADCKQASYAVQVTSTYKVLDLSSPGIIRVDYAPVTDGVQLMPHTDLQAQAWNHGRGHCGINDWQEGRAKSVDANCIDGVESRPTFSIVKIDGNNIFLGQPNTRDEDGYSPERRFSKIDSTITYVKKGALQPTPVQGVGVCPAFAPSYACESSGDEAFAGRDLTITTSGAEIDVTVAARGASPAVPMHFLADGAAHVNGNGHDFTDTTTSTCAAATLTSHDVVTRSGNAAAGSVTDFTFRTNGDTLVIDTSTQMGTDAAKLARTFCKKM